MVEEGEEEKPDYMKLDHNGFVEEARKSRGMDLEKRLNRGHEILVSYRQAPKVGSEHVKRAVEIDIGELSKDLYKTFEEKANEGKTLTYNEQMDFFKKISNVVGPAMKIGNEDTPDDNYKHLELYLDKFDSLTKQEAGTTRGQVLQAIKEGHAAQAKQIIVNAIIAYHRARDETALLHEIVPPDDQDYHLGAAEVLAKKINEEYKAAGQEKEVIPADIARDIHQAYRDRAKLTIDNLNKYMHKKPEHQEA